MYSILIYFYFLWEIDSGDCKVGNGRPVRRLFKYSRQDKMLDQTRVVIMEMARSRKIGLYNI